MMDRCGAKKYARWSNLRPVKPPASPVHTHTQTPVPTTLRANFDATPRVHTDAESGVQLGIILGQVPVVGLDKLSVFQESASWLLQEVVASEGKAGSLYEVIDDSTIYAKCGEMGISKEETAIARCTATGLEDVVAVGTTGKRSIMLSLVFGVLISGRV